jgi:hypothetical protein
MLPITPPTPQSAPTTDQKSEILVLKRLVRHLESHLRSPFSIEALAREFGLKRRGFYDFISICSTFDICRRVGHNCLEWCGISHSIPILNTIRLECRQEPPDRSLKEIFNYSLDASLQKLAVAVIKLFFILNVRLLDLRKVCRLLAQHDIKYPTMLRKLYSVRSGLEVAQIINKTDTVLQIQLLVPLEGDAKSPALKLSSLLNTQKEIEEQRVCEERRREFEELCSGMDHKDVFQVGQSFAPALSSVAIWG